MPSKDISRGDLLILLASMNVVIPEDTKMTAEQLSKRLGEAFDTAQQLSENLDSPTVDATTLPKWIPRKGETLFEVTQQGNLVEGFTGEMRQPKQGGMALKVDTFKEMRQSVLGIAYACDKGINEIFLRDANNRWAVFIKIMAAYEVKNEVPLFFFFYTELSSTSSEDLDEQIRETSSSGETMTLAISDLERRALLKLFSRNSKNIDHSVVKKAQNELTKTGLHPSFVLPLCPLNMRDLGKLTDPGCAVCGKKNTNRCVQCLMIAYCGKECQTADWPSHKEACKSVKGGTWQKMTLSPSALPFFSMLNARDTKFRGKGVNTHDAPPPDAHKGKMFLAKFQLPLSGLGDMLVYDRQRTFTLCWKPTSQPALYQEAARMIGHRMKFYRWMRRTGDYDFEICLDRAPPQDPVW
ncbi:hypothetical protein D9613_007247 [Agrocybe pediades]|uniref:MYND-type domain-containing protein n=1 Tax=Agrocybe pediades TaxID=84607 RepID=A0A8H4QHW6_9AGAR|nr:hypothetical protein D9613_007247 [Agrocybe pediades]